MVHGRARRLSRALLILLVSGPFAAYLAMAAPVDPAPLSNAAPILAQLAAQAKDRNLKEEERLDAVRALSQWHTAEVNPPLLDLLKDPAVQIRAGAATGLGWRGNAVALVPLKERGLDAAEDPRVRAAAVGSIVKIGDASIRPLLVETSKDPNPLVREEALRGLIDGPLQDPSDRLDLATRSAQDGALTLQFRADAIRVLGELKNPASVPVLLNILENGPRAQIVFPPATASQNEILQSRYKQIQDIRAWAARSLGELGDRSALPALLKALEDADDAFLRYVTTGALISWRAPETVPAFVKRLDDPAMEVRVVALAALSQVGDQSNVDAIAARLDDKTPQVRVAAVSALASLGGATARQRLTEARQRESRPEVQQAIDEAMARMKP
jgi:HEAT repeat protein